jgi:hypothetical protein
MLYRITKSITIEGTAHSAGSFVDSGECPHILPCIESCVRLGQIEAASVEDVKAFESASAAKEVAAVEAEKAAAAKTAPVPDPPLAAKTKPKRARAKS